MGFDPYNRSLKIWESIETSTPQNGSSLGSVKVHYVATLLCRNLTMRKCEDEIHTPEMWT